MEKRLKNYLAKMEALLGSGEQNIRKVTAEEYTCLLEDLLIQIGFFQHERLVHLIVTVTFAIMTIVSLLGSLLVSQPALLALIFLLLVLLIPYIRHYYILENGVQKLYEYYDILKEKGPQ